VVLFGSDNLHVDQANLARGHLMVRTGRPAEAVASTQLTLASFATR